MNNADQRAAGESRSDFLIASTIRIYLTVIDLFQVCKDNIN